MDENKHNILVGDRLEAIRVLYRTLAKDFSKELGITEYEYRQLKLNQKYISLNVINALQEKYNINPDWILFGLGNVIKS